jgi:hypothetical protein
MRALLLIALASTALLACGTDEAPPATTGPEPTATTTGSPAATSLTITVEPGASAATQTYTLTCDPSGGEHPDPDNACAALEDAGAAEVNPLDPVAPELACTEIYGGEQTAVVEGTVAGEPIRAEFSRINGCEISRWDVLLPVLVEPGGVRE